MNSRFVVSFAGLYKEIKCKSPWNAAMGFLNDEFPDANDPNLERHYGSLIHVVQTDEDTKVITHWAIVARPPSEMSFTRITRVL